MEKVEDFIHWGEGMKKKYACGGFLSGKPVPLSERGAERVLPVQEHPLFTLLRKLYEAMLFVEYVTSVARILSRKQIEFKVPEE